MSCLTSCKYTTPVTIIVKDFPIKSDVDGKFPELTIVGVLIDSTVTGGQVTMHRDRSGSPGGQPAPATLKV